MQAKFSVRADLYRVCHSFMDAQTPKYTGVRIEPLERGGGVVMVGWNGADLIAIEDETSEIERPATIYVGRSMVNMAVDLFRRGGIETRLVGRGDVAVIEPEAAGSPAVREYEHGAEYPDWRAVMMARNHDGFRVSTPIVFGARMARSASDAAIGLAAAAGGAALENFEFAGSDESATVVTFPAWPRARAIFKQPAPVLAR